MSNILFIVGLPGSGKTRLAQQINKDNNYEYKIIDDPKDFDIDVKPYLNRNIIITDPNLCFENNRQKATSLINHESPDSSIEWIFFENDPESCLLNAEVRNRANSISFKPAKKVDSFIKNLSKHYTIPESANIVSVYKTI